MKTALRVEGLSKKFQVCIGGRQRPDTLPEAVRQGCRSMARRMRGQAASEEFWALRNVAFEVAEGERLGIIGANGAGKSTLLKIISRIYPPTEGRVSLNGRVTSLLEVNTGFHPDLTGRENIYLKGAIHGLSMADMNQRFDSIVEFSGVERFIDTPIKHYSSGMYLRLAFSVSAHLDPDIFIADEVLAVGDSAFQKKCLQRMGEIREQGATVLFVSHDMGAIRNLCSRCIVLRRGELVVDSTPEEAISAYLSALGADAVGFGKTDLAEKPQYGSMRARLQSVQLTPIDPDGKENNVMRPGYDLKVAIEVKSQADISDVNPAVVIFDSGGFRLIDVNAEVLRTGFDLVAGATHLVEYVIRDVLLKPGTYSIGLWLGKRNKEDICALERAADFEVSGSGETLHYPGPYQCRFDFAHRMLEGA